MVCENPPCEAQKNFEKLTKWAISAIIVGCGTGIGFCLSQSAKAEKDAMSAKEKASNVAVLENEVGHIRDEMKMVNLKLESINEIKVTMAQMAGNMELTLAKIDNLERSD